MNKTVALCLIAMVLAFGSLFYMLQREFENRNLQELRLQELLDKEYDD